MAARGFVLTFHSHNIAGNVFADNDHAALDGTLATLRRLRLPVVRLLDAVVALRRHSFDALPQRFACITFDDGSAYDWRDTTHPTHGPQRSMRSILAAHSRRLLGLLWLRRMHATSFVIASPRARSEIARAALGEEKLMDDSWWRDAQRSGLMDIGSHGWNHVHPAASEVAATPDLAERFDRIATLEEAQLQVDRAFDSIRAVAGGASARIFAYPYGQVSDFIANEYLPRQRRIAGAVAVAPRPMTADCDPWRIPRYVCGPDWSSVEGLEALLRG